jgi:hypothetical protein
MSDEKRGDLTLGQQRFLERMQEAQKEGVSLPDYYRAHGLSMAMLYKVRRQLVQKGLVPATRAPAQMEAGPGKFVQVRVPQSLGGAELADRGTVCRLRHPSGWLIECGMWPHPQWRSCPQAWCTSRDSGSGWTRAQLTTAGSRAD